ncbi:MAG: phage tail tape measure protein [Ruminococcus sp.]|nr:phage tail tape measure protein [Ruminococcus sp.]
MANSKKIKGLTVEIGGDTTKLSKALDDSKKKSKGLQSELKQVEKLLKLDPKNTELLAQKQQILSEQVAETKKRLSLMKDEQEKVNALFQKGEIGADEYRRYQREVEQTRLNLRDLESQLKNTDGKFADITQNINGINLGEAERKLADFGGSIKDMADTSMTKLENLADKFSNAGDKLESVGININTAVSSKVAQKLSEGVTDAMDFEDAMAKVSTIADENEVSMDKLRQQILDLSNETGVAATDVAENVYNAISAGQKNADAVTFVAQSLSLSKAGFADTGAALNVLTTIMNAYGMSAEKVGNISDMMIQTQNLGRVTVGELASSMGKVIPTANQYGVSLDQLAAAYSITTAKGIEAAESTTYINSMINELGKSDSKASKVLKESTGKTFTELMGEGKSLSDVLAILQESANENNKSLGDMFGSAEAAKAASTLLGDSAKEFNDRLREMNNSTGATEEALGKLKTTSSDTKKIVNELKNAGIDLGQEVLAQAAPILKEVMDGVKNVTKWLKKLSPEHKKVLTKVIEIAAVAGPVVTLIGKGYKGIGNLIGIIPKAASAVKGFGTALNANPVGAWTTAIVLAVTAIASLSAAVKAYSDLKWESTESAKFAEEVDKAAGALEESAQKISETTQRTFDEIDENIKNNSLIDTYQAELDKLLGKQNLTDEEKSKLDLIVTYLTDNVSGFSEAWERYTIRDGNDNIKLVEDLDTVKKALSDTIDEFQKSSYIELMNKAYNDSLAENFDAITKRDAIRVPLEKEEKQFEKRLAELGISREKFVDAFRRFGEGNLFNYKDIPVNTNLNIDDYTELAKLYSSISNARQDLLNLNTELSKSDALRQDALDVIQVLNGNYDDAAAVLMAYGKNMISLEDITRNGWSNIQELEKAAAESHKNTVFGVGQDQLDAETKYYESAGEITDDFKSRIVDGQGQIKESLSDTTEAVKAESPPLRKAMGDAADMSVQRYVSQIYAGKPGSETAGKVLGNSAKKGVESVDTGNTGQNFVSGFINALSDNSVISGVWNAAKSIGSTALNAIKDFLGIHSPSTKAYEAGDYFTEGFLNALRDGEPEARKRAAEFAQTARNALEGKLHYFTDSVPYTLPQARILTDYTVTHTHDIRQSAEIRQLRNEIQTMAASIDALAKRPTHLYIDGKTWVGSTIDETDRQLAVLEFQKGRGG